MPDDAAVLDLERDVGHPEQRWEMLLAHVTENRVSVSPNSTMCCTRSPRRSSSSPVLKAARLRPCVRRCAL